MDSVIDFLARHIKTFNRLQLSLSDFWDTKYRYRNGREDGTINPTNRSNHALSKVSRNHDLDRVARLFRTHLCTVLQVSEVRYREGGCAGRANDWVGIEP